MKALSLLLQSWGFPTDSLRPLFESDGRTAAALDVTATDSRHTWERLRALMTQSGWWPVLLSTSGEFPIPPHTTADLEQPDRSFDDILAAAEKIDFPAWIAAKHARRIKGLQEEIAADRLGGEQEPDDYLLALLRPRGEFRGLPRTPWPGDDPMPSEEIEDRLMSFAELSDHRLTLALVPVREGWQVPAMLRWGAGLYPYDPALHCAALRSWHDRFGAELVTLGEHIMHVRVARPPTTRRDALRLVKEQFHYCCDVVNCLDSIDELAAWLIRGEVWYFLWDE